MNGLTLVVMYLGLTLLSVAAAVVSYTHLHEYSHYLVGKTQTSEMEIQYKFGIIPHRVWFHKPYDLSPNRVRLAGLAPAVTGVTLTVWFALRWGTPETIPQTILYAVSLATLALSPSDLLAVFFPEEFQRQTADGFDMTQIEILRYILARLYPV